MYAKFGKSRLLGAVVMGMLSGGVAAQGRTLGANDYAQAERFMAYNTTPLVDHAVQKVHWLDATTSGIAITMPVPIISCG